MSFRFDFDPGFELVTVTAAGTSDFRANLDALTALVQRPEFRSVKYILCDFRRFDYIPTPEDRLRFGRILASADGVRSRRLAYVVTSKQLGAARTVAIVAGAWGMDVEVFDTPQAAERWLRAGSVPQASN